MRWLVGSGDKYTFSKTFFRDAMVRDDEGGESVVLTRCMSNPPRKCRQRTEEWVRDVGQVDDVVVVVVADRMSSWSD